MHQRLLPFCFLLLPLTASAQTVTDIDGNVYNTVTINGREWMAENLATSHYQDGSPIPLVSNPTTWFNMIVSGTVAAVTGFNPFAVFGVGSVLGTMVKPVAGALPMAVQKEIWMNHIVENLFADNSFLSKAFDADEFVNQGKTVHIPNAGAPSNVVKNRNTFPAEVKSRDDIDLTFDLDNYSTDPIKINLTESD